MAIIKYRESPTAEWQELPVVNKVSVGYLPEEALTITGDCPYRFAYNSWNWFIEQHGDQIITKNITEMTRMFYDSSELEEIPFELNCLKHEKNIGYLFYACTKLKNIPKINGEIIPTELPSLFEKCRNLRHIPEDIGEWFDWSYMDGINSKYSGMTHNIFMDCHSLRKIPISLLERGNPNINDSYSIYNGLCGYCYVLDEIVDLPYPHYNTTWTSNSFRNLVTQCNRLKNLTFKTPDGAPYVVNWKTQTIELTNYVGYALSKDNILNFNSGITEDKRVTNDVTYQALKNDPDWWTTDIAYSRYNHDSAVATINSLPDTSAYLAEKGGTNTIKFKGAAGSKTDGGAINTLTDAEIAVAAAKGWTVSLS